MSLADSKTETEAHHAHTIHRDPTGLVRLPADSVRVEDLEEEVFLLYTHLSTRRPQDSSSSSFPGLGSVDSRQDTLAVRFTLPPSPAQRHKSTPMVLESSSSHATKRHGKHTKTFPVPKPAQEEERTLEIELLQDKTALRSKRGDTGSVLWRVSVALGQAFLNDLCSDSPSSLLDPEKLKECDVLELGAGTGLLSLVLAPWVHHYTVTDLEYLVPLIRKNVAANWSAVQQTLKPARNTSAPSSRRSKRSVPAPCLPTSEDRSETAVSVEPLDWLALQRVSAHTRSTCFRLARADPPDLIILADCVYNPALLPSLLAAVEHYALPGQTCVLVAVELRAADVVREFLGLWAASGAWEIWRVGGGGGDGGDGWLGVDFAVWVGWKVACGVQQETMRRALSKALWAKAIRSGADVSLRSVV